MADRLRQIRLEPAPMSPRDTKAYFDDETALWGKVIKDAHIEAQ